MHTAEMMSDRKPQMMSDLKPHPVDIQDNLMKELEEELARKNEMLL